MVERLRRYVAPPSHELSYTNIRQYIAIRMTVHRGTCTTFGEAERMQSSTGLTSRLMAGGWQ